MPLQQSIQHLRGELIGAAVPAFADALKATGGALAGLRARHADGSLPLLRLPAKTDDLAATREAARRLTEGASDIVLLGTGGAGLRRPTPPPPARAQRPGGGLAR